MNTVIDWLLHGEPWVEYNTRLHLLGEGCDGKEVLNAKSKMLAHPQIKGLLGDFEKWNEEIISNHKNAGLLLHKLSFLADIGLTIKDQEISELVHSVMAHRTGGGVIQVPVNVPQHFGGSGQDTWGWCLCDTPTILYALAKFGLSDDPHFKSALDYLVSLASDDGWGCHVSPELGKFRGPGKKDDPCPYATLVMLKTLAQLPRYADNKESRNGAEGLLSLWARSRERHPYMFYMGTDFRKLKVPFVWYDVLHVSDVLSQLDWLRDDPRLLEMLELIRTQANDCGMYTPQSEWRAWNGWEFSQKKNPSRWLTYLVLRLLRRIEGIQI